uniref:Uncharacterized protein n=1 Tax=Junco hyemalis TaxID=40217 RepID=A0A8C5JM97_JUNHY
TKQGRCGSASGAPRSHAPGSSGPSSPPVPRHSPPRSPAPASGRSPTAPWAAPGPCSPPSHPGALCLTFSGSEGFLTISAEQAQAKVIARNQGVAN